MTSAAATSDSAAERSLGRTFLVLWLAISAVATPLVAVFVGRLIPPGNGSEQATSQVFDNQVLMAVSTPIFVFVVLFIVFAAFAFSNRTGEVVEGAPLRGNMRIQVLWMVVTTATVLFMAVFGTIELVGDGAGGGQGPTAAFVPSGSKDALDVQVIGQQWEFTYRYPSAGGVETPRLELPANTLVRFHVTSLDAVHSFWAYELGVKADANPGTDNVVYVRTKGPLTIHVRCAELCGLWHGYMFDTGAVVPKAAFATWLQRQRTMYGPVMRYLPKYAPSYVPDPQLRAG
ncbi:MAG TPA: cytochrome c oxidase subunit II [Gaiellaceae bacterium]|nr:cytochrome c oxidase subunit II [Gaiellaceae bacterium]